MTKIVVAHEHLVREYNWWGKGVSEDKMHAFERELMYLVNPDKMLVPEAYFQLCNYALQRYPQIRGVKTKMSRLKLTWLFQQEIQWEGKPTFIPRNLKFSCENGTNRPRSYMIEW